MRESLKFMWNLEENSNKNFELFLYRQQFRRCYYGDTDVAIMCKHFISLFNHQIQPKNVLVELPITRDMYRADGSFISKFVS